MVPFKISVTGEQVAAPLARGFIALLPRERVELKMLMDELISLGAGVPVAAQVQRLPLDPELV
jgi:hypothetical protein